MGDPVTATIVAGGALAAGGSVMSGVSQYQAGKSNAKAYKQQANAILAQQQNVASQYRAKGVQVAGQAVTSAARGGLKIKGTVAESINQSLTNLEVDKTYEMYNLEVQRVNALNSAKMSKYQGRQALFSSVLSGAGSALGTAGKAHGGGK